MSWKNKLQEYCQANHSPFPRYSCFRNQDHDWVATCQVGNEESKGDPCSRKVDSEQSAAQIMYESLLASNELSTRRPQRSQRLRRPPRQRPQRTSHQERQEQQDTEPLNEIRSIFGLRLPVNPRNNTARNNTARNNEVPTQTFPHIMDQRFLNHLRLLVRNKNVDILTFGETPTDAQVIIYFTSARDFIKSTFTSESQVHVEIPCVDNFQRVQAMIMNTACMELGASTCTISEEIEESDVRYINLNYQ